MIVLPVLPMVLNSNKMEYSQNLILLLTQPILYNERREKREGRRKKEEGRRKKEEGRRRN